MGEPAEHRLAVIAPAAKHGPLFVFLHLYCTFFSHLAALRGNGMAASGGYLWRQI